MSLLGDPRLVGGSTVARRDGGNQLTQRSVERVYAAPIRRTDQGGYGSLGPARGSRRVGPMTAEVADQNLLAARMLNEFVYCPRLFYFEWVDDRWADSADTEHGRFTHRAVDKPVGALPDPELEGWLRRARSIRIEDSELGLVAVLDRVEFSDGTTVPIEVKSGRPTPAGEPWPADRIQVLVHVVLLRRRGFTVPSAVIYYAATNQRVDVEIPDDVENEIRALVVDARATAGQLRPPLPLVSSPKCPRCSLVGLCLPDETNALLEEQSCHRGGSCQEILPSGPCM